LCVVYAEAKAGCCDPPPRPPAAPVRPDNSPGLSAVRYRIGTFTTFRRAMLDELAQAAPPHPFANWREGTDGDYLTMLVELWAYLADVLTFYQERIANEAFLPTATQRDSLLRLSRLIDYRPSPGAGAGAQLAFTAEKDKTVAVPAGFRVGSKAAAGKPSAVFETDAALSAAGAYSAIPLSTVAPTNQFAPLENYITLAVPETQVVGQAAAAASTVYGTAGALFFQTFHPTALFQATASSPSAQVLEKFQDPVTRTLSAARTTLASGPVTFLTADRSGFSSRPSVERFPPASFERRVVTSQVGQRQVVLKGTATRLAVGDYVLVVENQGNASEKQSLRQVSTVTPDKASDTTTITWTEQPNTRYENVTLYALRVTASPFGSTAPVWNTLSPTLIGTVNGVDGPYKDRNWDATFTTGTTPNPWYYLPTPDDPPGVLYLDGIHEAVKGTPDNPGWAVLLNDDTTQVIDDRNQVFHVIDARPASKAAYTMSSRVTRLTFAANEAVRPLTFPVRGTVVLTGAEPLELQNNLPLPEPLAGNKLILAGLYPDLKAGQTVIVRGQKFDAAAHLATQTVGAEPAILAGPPELDPVNDLTTVTLQRPLAGPYARAAAVLLANVVGATQGESVRDEVLGSSDGSAFQSFPLKKKPLTYLPAPDAEGLASVRSTLLVTVNAVRWDQKPSLLDSAPDDPAYTTTQDEAGQTMVVFGDGYFGARPPSGRDNIRARYRKGLGTSGNVAADAIVQMIASLPGLQKVTNPLLSSGGADPEDSARIRANAPASLRTFGRAVSAADHAALARTFPGVAKASAAWILRGPDTLKALPQPYLRLTVASADGVPLAQQPPDFLRKLRNFLDRRRDPNMPLRVVDFLPVYLDVGVAIDVDDRFPRLATVARVQAALRPGPNPDGQPGYFAFERLQFGQSIHLSSLYAAVQAVPGVRGAVVTVLRRLDSDADSGVVQDAILIRPTELAVVGNDPGEPGKGTLTVTWREGGFIDT
jgi:predicted phage baseplate assembly protein